jgi:hypothetical protein
MAQGLEQAFMADPLGFIENSPIFRANSENGGLFRVLPAVWKQWA